MRKLILIVMTLAVLGLMVTNSSAAKHLPEERGKALFEDPAFAGGKVACNSCHPNGTGLMDVGNRTRFRVAGQTQDSLEEAVNACIKYASRGTPIPVDSQEMKDIVSYIRSLGK